MASTAVAFLSVKDFNQQLEHKDKLTMKSNQSTCNSQLCHNIKYNYINSNTGQNGLVYGIAELNVPLNTV